mmetsp:Transcript_1506/g.3451  ORF Transcript_1506/g.3451 Transcript_1506/m.3451 type:complete len:232 (-) Transcript_1506:138-833(-)
MGHDGRLTNTGSVNAAETQKWSAMDSSMLRTELHHVATERNKAAAAVGAIARNCSGELEQLYFKFKKKKQARDTLREEFDDLKKTKEKLQEEHKALRKHTSEKVLKHMEEQGIDVEFIQPHHMDVDTLLKAAAKADEHRAQKELRAAITAQEKRHEKPDIQTLVRYGDTKKLAKHVKEHVFKTVGKELYDDKRLKRMGQGKDPDTKSKREREKDAKEAEKAALKAALKKGR